MLLRKLEIFFALHVFLNGIVLTIASEKNLKKSGSKRVSLDRLLGFNYGEEGAPGSNMSPARIESNEYIKESVEFLKSITEKIKEVSKVKQKVNAKHLNTDKQCYTCVIKALNESYRVMGTQLSAIVQHIEDTLNTKHYSKRIRTRGTYIDTNFQSWFDYCRAGLPKKEKTPFQFTELIKEDAENQYSDENVKGCMSSFVEDGIPLDPIKSTTETYESILADLDTFMGNSTLQSGRENCLLCIKEALLKEIEIGKKVMNYIQGSSSQSNEFERSHSASKISEGDIKHYHKLSAVQLLEDQLYFADNVRSYYTTCLFKISKNSVSAVKIAIMNGNRPIKFSSQAKYNCLSKCMGKFTTPVDELRKSKLNFVKTFDDSNKKSTMISVLFRVKNSDEIDKSNRTIKDQAKIFLRSTSNNFNKVIEKVPGKKYIAKLKSIKLPGMKKKKEGGEDTHEGVD